MPINKDGEHWYSLLVDLENQKFYFYDSLHTTKSHLSDTFEVGPPKIADTATVRPLKKIFIIKPDRQDDLVLVLAAESQTHSRMARSGYSLCRGSRRSHLCLPLQQMGIREKLCALRFRSFLLISSSTDSVLPHRNDSAASYIKRTESLVECGC